MGLGGNLGGKFFGNMEVKSKLFKRKTGKSKGKWVVRIEYFDQLAGKKKFTERLTAKRSDASDERDRLINDIKKTHGQIHAGERMTFSSLADICAKGFYQPAVLVEGRKIEGVRAHNTAANHLTVLKQFFGDRLIGQITTQSLRDYRLSRLKQGSRHPSIKEGTKVPVKLATINRELSAMRRIMRYAYGQGWVTKDIFFKAEVIDASAEIERTRKLSAAEEVLLLEACQGTRQVPYERTRHGKQESIIATHNVDNPHLKAMILLAIDAGMRRGEILKLEWKDIDFRAGLIRILGTNTKTERERLVPLTERVKAELYNVKEFSYGDRPFPFRDFKRSWATAKRIAGIEDLHFHDLRRTAITRWIQQGNPIALAGKIAGHARLETTMKHYTSSDAEIVTEFTEKMNAVHDQTVQALSGEVVN